MVENRSADHAVLAHVQDGELPMAVLQVELDAGAHLRVAVAHVGERVVEPAGCAPGSDGRGSEISDRTGSPVDRLMSGRPFDSTRSPILMSAVRASTSMELSIDAYTGSSTVDIVLL